VLYVLLMNSHLTPIFVYNVNHRGVAENGASNSSLHNIFGASSTVEFLFSIMYKGELPPEYYLKPVDIDEFERHLLKQIEVLVL